MKRCICMIAALCLLMALGGCQNEDGLPKPGVIEGNHYRSDWIGIECDLPEQFTVKSADELRKNNGIPAEGDAAEEEIRKAIESAEVLYDYYGYNATTGSLLTVATENLPLLYESVPTEAEYTDLCREKVEKSLAEIGLTAIVIEKTTLPFLGADRAALKVSGRINGDTPVPFFETMVFIKKDSYMILFTASTVETDDTVPLLENFKAVG